MKNKVRGKRIICTILIAILSILIGNVYASTDSFKTSLSADHSTVKRGENVSITIALSDIAIESGEKGIGAYTAHIDFDSSSLEYIETNGNDKWEAPLYQNKKITGNTDDGEVVKTAQNIGSITFKVKDNAKLGETTITLTDFSGSNAKNDVDADDSSVTITIVDENGGTGSGSQGENAAGNASGNGANQNGVANNNKPNSENTNKEDIKPGTLPQTGNSNVAIFLSIGVLLALAIICLVRIRLLKNKR